MRTYELVEISYVNRVQMRSSNPKIPSEFNKNLVDWINTAQMTKSLNTEWEWTWEKLQNSDWSVFHWCKVWLLSRGFEPFTVYPNHSLEGTGFPIYSFRRAIEKSPETGDNVA